MTYKDITGEKFGKLTVISAAGRDKGSTVMWRCVCECGETRTIAGTGLRAGRHKSCGCSSPRFTSERVTTHGRSRTRVYVIWRGMLSRCSDKAKGKSRQLYFDKGIRVCPEWHKFENFFRDVGEPEPWQTLERRDGSKGYSKDNCRWASKKEQANNTTQNVKVELNGKRQNVSQWGEALGIKPNTITCRLRRGWETERALAKKPVFSGTIRKLKRQRPCMGCGAAFIPRPNQLRNGRGKFCSHGCDWSSRKLGDDGRILSAVSGRS